ncbi:MAG: tetratricopeptide repeat protein [Blastocatellia bacterium]|nr:tetratricopeptide repeat protein [Blastocatellia bacterium]
MATWPSAFILDCMHLSWKILTSAVLGTVIMLALSSCARRATNVQTAAAETSTPDVGSAKLSKSGQTSMVAVRFLEDRVKSDPDDVIALQKLANYYLQLHRETADIRYLELALRSARSSLRVLPADQNLSGLLVLAQAEYQTHDFSSARDHAKELTEYQPRKSYGYQVLGDALLELGDYEQAEQAYRKMEELDRGSVATETRLAHLAVLQGDPTTAQRRYVIALAQAKAALVPSAESIAWCHWQLGETTFAIGDYPAAERHYRDALTTFPNYFRALASLGRIRAALDDRAGAIEQYEHAVRIVPDPQFVAMLGDLYKLAGRDKDAASQYSLVEKIARLNELNGALYNRQVAVFYADHDLKPEEAYAKALREYGVRRDIYGADALAWTALKSGKIAEAQSTIKEALRLGTKDARLFYHTGMIAQAAGDNSGARDYLKRALTLNPQFDPLQAPIARKTLEQ